MIGESFADPRNCSDLYRHTVPIFDFDRGEPALVGTGVFVAVREHHFVVTAAHVLEPGFKKIGFGYHHTPAGFEVFGADNMLILTAKAQRGEGDNQRAVYKDDLDLAVIQPTDAVLEKLRGHFRAFELRRNCDLGSSPWGMVSGWPARKNTYNRRKRRCDFDRCYHIQFPVAPREKVIEAGWNPDVHLALWGDRAKDFANAVGGEHIHLPLLEGVSGGGFWVPVGDGWSLAAIIVEEHPAKRLLKAIKIEHIWKPLDHFCANLARDAGPCLS